MPGRIPRSIHDERGTTVTQLTPREWQDIEEAKSALRIDAGWHDAAPTSAPQEPEPAAVTPQTDGTGDGVPRAGREARSAGAPGSAMSPTPESKGLPTAG
jgi:hypothetical protein